MIIVSHNDPAILEKTLEVLRAGGVVVVPTDTVYGLIADATSAAAVEKVYAIKKRDPQKPLGIFVRDETMLEKYARVPRDLSRKLFSIWPGALTAILPSGPTLAYQDGQTIGVRVPAHPFLQSLLKNFGKPLLQTSANISGHGSFTKKDDVLWDLEPVKNAIDLFVDGSDLVDSMASSAVDFTLNPPKITREGDLKKADLKKILGSFQ